MAINLNRPIVVDTGPLGEIVHPRASASHINQLRKWLELGLQIVIPEVADYKLRRKLIHKGFSTSVDRLDELIDIASYLPCRTEHFRQAAQIWAACRSSGRPNADDSAIDGDALITAQALSINGIVLTHNVRDFSNYVEAESWESIEHLISIDRDH